jgi:hypothetical protein
MHGVAPERAPERATAAKGAPIEHATASSIDDPGGMTGSKLTRLSNEGEDQQTVRE